MENLNADTSDGHVLRSVGARLLVPLVLLLALALFVPRLFAHPWLDELGSYWVVKDGIRRAVERSLEIQGQSPLYYIVLCLTLKALGAAPWALRIPSLVCTVISSLVVFRLGALIAGRIVGFWSAFGFLISLQLAGVAVEARPYALAIMCAALSSLLFMRWLSTPNKLSALMYSLSVALTLYAHYLFGSVVVAHLLLFLFVLRQVEGKLRSDLFSGVLFIVAVTVVLTIPALAQLYQLSSKTDVLSFAQPLTASAVLWAMVPWDVLLVLLVMLCFRLTIWRAPRFAWRSALPKQAVLPVVILALTPPLGLAAASLLSGHSLWLERYYSWQCLGIGLGIGVVLSLLHSWPRQVVIGMVVLAITVARQLAGPSDLRDREGWGAVLETLRAADPQHECLVLSMSGFVESRMLGRGQTAVIEDFLRAPLAYYAIANESTVIPYSLDDQDAQRYLQNTTLPALAQTRCAWLLYRDVKLHSERFAGEDAWAWMRRALPDLGFRPTSEMSRGVMRLIRYERPPVPPSGIN
jgi:uncharacterized membrane protein